jgi:hypothetical protein
VAGGPPLPRTLLADTGAGTENVAVRLLLRDADCISCGVRQPGTIGLGRAYRGPHLVYLVRIAIPALGYAKDLQAAAIAAPPAYFDGTACFSFLNEFTYGNFGDPRQFGLER